MTYLFSFCLLILALWLASEIVGRDLSNPHPGIPIVWIAGARENKLWVRHNQGRLPTNGLHSAPITPALLVRKSPASGHIKRVLEPD